VVVDDADFGRRIDPLLGGTLVLAAYGDPDDPAVVAALDTPDAEKAKALADATEDVDIRADGSTLVIALNHGAAVVRDAIARKQAGDGLTAGPFADAFGTARTTTRSSACSATPGRWRGSSTSMPTFRGSRPCAPCRSSAGSTTTRSTRGRTCAPTRTA
jgi:hypothetical protein